MVSSWVGTRNTALTVLLRFALCYFGLFYLADVLMYLRSAGVGWPEDLYLPVARAVATFSSEELLGLGAIPVWVSGSGDKIYDWALTFAILLIAVLVSGVWTVVARGRGHTERLHAALRVWLRFNLFYTMLIFGLSKVFKTQFPMPDVDRLIQPFGMSSPQGLLWTFMGYSYGYTVFAGIAEVVGALLLVSKRTTTLGALVLTGALANVWVMNMSYDVPVKLYSFHLLMSCVILLLPDLSRLTRVLLLNLPTGPFTAPALLPVRWGKSAFFLKTVFVVVAVVQQTIEDRGEHLVAEDHGPTS